jgi:hypothetical protein
LKRPQVNPTTHLVSLSTRSWVVRLIGGSEFSRPCRTVAFCTCATDQRLGGGGGFCSSLIGWTAKFARYFSGSMAAILHKTSQPNCQLPLGSERVLTIVCKWAISSGVMAAPLIGQSLRRAIRNSADCQERPTQLSVSQATSGSDVGGSAGSLLNSNSLEGLPAFLSPFPQTQQIDATSRLHLLSRG